MKLLAHNKSSALSFSKKNHMRLSLSILFLSVVFFTSCQKQDLTQTRVGFYVIDPNAQAAHDGSLYSLYIDHQYRGKLNPSFTASNDSTLMNFQTLNSQKHIIEVKKLNSLVSSTYLLIRKNEIGSGTAGQTSGQYVNGGQFTRNTGLSYSTYAIFQ